MRRGDQHNAVARLEPERAAGNGHVVVVAALNRADQHVGARERRQLHQRLARKGRVRLQNELQKLHMAVSERVGTHGRRQAQAARDLGGAGQLRVDGEAQAQILGDERKLGIVFRIPDAGDGVLRAGLLCDQAAKQVQLVRGRHRDQQVGRIHARLKLGLIGRAVSFDAEDVKILGRLLKRIGAAVDNGDVVSLAGKLFGKGASDLAIADDDDFHAIQLLFRAFFLHYSAAPRRLQQSRVKTPFRRDD